MAIDRIGWDIGGAHLKAAAFDGADLVGVAQQACPLWLGLEHFHTAARAILAEFAPAPGCRHAVTMTGELADVFANRTDGVFGLLQALAAQVPPDAIRVFAGPIGWLTLDAVQAEHVALIASANWLATGYFAAAHLPQALLLDIGSTTTDVLILRDGKVLARGHSDYERLRDGELIYSGVVRTSLMALADAAPLDGDPVGLMAEHFATTADVYRLTGELPASADQSATADGAEKTVAASARRLARLTGRDVESAPLATWQGLAQYFRERQLAKLLDACLRQLSRGELAPTAPLIGAGVGRFLVAELARRLHRPFVDFDDLAALALACRRETPHTTLPFHPADCAPAVAVAFLALRNHD